MIQNVSVYNYFISAPHNKPEPHIIFRWKNLYNLAIILAHALSQNSWAKSEEKIADYTNELEIFTMS